jgi:predicted RNase H-like HicB family nuclease
MTMATNTYIALIHKDPDSDYGASFPDLPGCVAVASSLDEVLAEAKEALAFHIEGMVQDREGSPSSCSGRCHRSQRCFLDGRDRCPRQVERINMTIPAIALARFDNFALRYGMTRSALFVEAVNLD